MPSILPTPDLAENEKSGRLYVVATPIGNREDITLRALRILGSVDCIAAEDTRKTGRLLAHYQIKKRLVSYHEHNENERSIVLLHKLQAGQTIALVSNSGTPLISDPGYRLIQAAIENGIIVTPVPGVSAAITALSVSGLPTDSFVFLGFPVKKKEKRLKQLKALAADPRTMIFYESPKRITSLVQEILSLMGDRYGVLSREMTKLFETFERGLLSELLLTLKDRPLLKGECTLLIMGYTQDPDADFESIQSEIRRQLKQPGESLSALTKRLAEKHHLPRKRIYQAALTIRRNT
ncbi:MAG: 16S rRNA (cytidine(1402)-2'-O)-methyltransferase [Desulfobacterales bacterium]|nr:16S rRNA (cytidine(1402)-2'-O)-methyltransferase [Desulfobacterales bacterium]